MLVKVRMNTAAAIQLRDLNGHAAGFSAVTRGDEVEIDEKDANGFIKAGYATRIDKATK